MLRNFGVIQVNTGSLTIAQSQTWEAITGWCLAQGPQSASTTTETTGKLSLFDDQTQPSCHGVDLRITKHLWRMITLANYIRTDVYTELEYIQPYQTLLVP